MDVAEYLGAQRITAIRLNVANMDRAVTFYEAGLGFAVERQTLAVTTMTLGGERIELVHAPSNAAPYPPQPQANDPWFQHFAIRVSDMPAAYARLKQQHPVPISQGGPQQLPPSTGSVIAYKFRDPDGHPLELSFSPSRMCVPEGSALFTTIDHTALAVADLDKSIAFWVGLVGLRETGRLLNEGPTQWRLDGLPGALVDIVVLEVPGGGPHLELLHYRSPSPAKQKRRFGLDDIAATRLRIRAAPQLTERRCLEAMEVRQRAPEVLVLVDPDEHIVEITTRPAEHS